MARGIYLNNTDLFVSFLTTGDDQSFGYGPYDNIGMAKAITTRHKRWYSDPDTFAVVKKLKPYIDLDGKPQLQWVTVWTSRDKDGDSR